MAATPVVKRILIIGAGLTGSMLSQLLRTHPLSKAGAALQLEVEVWDKSRGSGGRAGTSRISDSGARGDLGLQYLSTSPDPYTSKINPMYDGLLEAGVIAPLGCRLVGMNPKYVDPSKQHFVAVEGASSLAKHFLSGANVSFSKTVTSIVHVGTAADDGDGIAAAGAAAIVGGGGTAEQWRVSSSGGGGGGGGGGGKVEDQLFDGIVLTAPMPQVLGLGGDVQGLITGAGIRAKLEAVTYSSRWALAVEFAPSAWEQVKTLHWDARYVNKDEDAAICYLSIDRSKRGQEPSSAAAGPVLVVHTGVPWSLQHHSAAPAEEEPAGYRATVEAEILEHVKVLVPELFGGEAAQTPAATKLHKWRYSQIHKPVEGTPRAIAISAAPLLVLAGDAFTGSNFDNCRSSAERALELLQAHL